MNRENWKIDEDGVSVNSISKVLIPWIGTSLEIWFELEENQSWWTENQIQTFEKFLSLPKNSRNELSKELQFIYSSKLKKSRIEKKLFENIFESIDWKKSQICIPQLYDSENQYVILLPETKWKLTDSNFNLELELLYSNGNIELIEEMSGLWNRIEWFDDYLKRKTIFNKV